MAEVTFLKKKTEGGSLQKELAEAAKNNKPIYDKSRKLWFVNGVKFKRAENILGLIRGDIAPIKADDVQRKEHYTRQLQVQEIDPSDKDALPALYELLGGLIRTEAQQQAADEKAKQMRKDAKRRMIE